MENENIASFYPEYLAAHHNKTNRILHFVGATLFFVCIALAFIFNAYWLIAVAVLAGYILPGIGHHYFEKNKSFRSAKPILCVACATKMYFNAWLTPFKKNKKQ